MWRHAHLYFLHHKVQLCRHSRPNIPCATVSSSPSSLYFSAQKVPRTCTPYSWFIQARHSRDIPRDWQTWKTVRFWDTVLDLFCYVSILFVFILSMRMFILPIVPRLPGLCAHKVLAVDGLRCVVSKRDCTTNWDFFVDAQPFCFDNCVVRIGLRSCVCVRVLFYLQEHVATWLERSWVANFDLGSQVKPSSLMLWKINDLYFRLFVGTCIYVT